jgi:fructokinase
VIVVGGEALIDLLVGPDGSIAATPGGGPYNTARTIARLGVPVTFLGHVSNDRFGREIAAHLVQDGVTLGCPEPVAEPTTLAIAELDEHGQAQYRFYLDGTSVPRLVPSDLEVDRATGPVAVHVGTLGLTVEPIASTLESYVAGLPSEVVVMLDPNCRPSAVADPEAYRARIARVLRRADVVKASRDDLAYLRPGDDPVETARSLVGRAAVSAPALVLLTNGAGDVIACTATGEMRIAARPARVVDTVGAGDAFGGAFLAWWVGAGLGRQALVDEAAVRAAVEAAIEVAALTCERAGADPPHRADLAARGLDWGGTAR